MYSIEISNLTKKFKEKIAVNNISLKIKRENYLHYSEQMEQERLLQ